MTAISRRVLGLLGLIGLFALAACNLQNLQAPGLAKDKEDAVKAVFKAMQKGDLAAVPLGAEMQTPQAQAAIPQIFAAIPKGEPTKVRLLNWHSNWTALSGARAEDLETTHQYTFPAGMIDVTTVMRRQIPAQGQPGPWQLRGFHFQPSAATGAAAPAGKASPPAAPAATPAASTPAATGISPPGGNQFVEQPQDNGPAAYAKPSSDDQRSFAQDEARQDEIKKPDGDILQKPHR